MTQTNIDFADLSETLQRLLRLMNTPLGLISEGERLLPHLEALAQTFRDLGCVDVELTPKGVLYATLPARTFTQQPQAPVIGFLAHYGPLSDEPIRPGWRLLNYNGGDIVIKKEAGIRLTLEDFPDLHRLTGKSLLVSDGRQPLALNSRVGVAMMWGILDFFARRPEQPHAEIRFALTPEGLIARHEAHFDIERFGADYAYVLEAPGLGTLITECFNAATAEVVMRGRAAFPGYAQGKMVNAIKLLTNFIDGLPRDESPERTEGHQGFYHPVMTTGSVHEASALILIRDFGFESFEVRKSRLRAMAEDYEHYGEGTCTIEFVPEYENMGRVLSRSSRVIKTAMRACRSKGVTPEASSLRGTTDGARLTAKGVPCPAFFTGSLFKEAGAYYETLPVHFLEKTQSILIELAIESAGLKTLS